MTAAARFVAKRQRRPEGVDPPHTNHGESQRSSCERAAAPARCLFSLLLSLWASKEKVDSKTQNSLNTPSRGISATEKNFCLLKKFFNDIIRAC